MGVDEALRRLTAEIEELKARCVVSDEDMAHLRALMTIEFCAWYDPNSEAHREIGLQMRPHITALNDKFKFKK